LKQSWETVAQLLLGLIEANQKGIPPHQLAAVNPFRQLSTSKK
jgi:hypothetical protein